VGASINIALKTTESWREGLYRSAPVWRSEDRRNRVIPKSEFLISHVLAKAKTAYTAMLERKHADRPKGERRPADVIGNAVKVMRIAKGEESDDAPDDGKNTTAQELGSKGAAAHVKSVSPERRAEIAKAPAAKRWTGP
jgi:hypothetical protein